MTPQDQEFISKMEIGQYGDCQRAVIASLLDLNISEVPHFLKEAQGDPELYWNGIQSFLNIRGYAYLTADNKAIEHFYGETIDIYHEINGPSPRGNGLYHAVVGCNGRIVFDPHPSRDGLAGDPSEWHHAYLVKI